MVRNAYEGPERRSHERYSDDDYRNGSPFSGLPLWSRVVAMVGIPGAIAIFLVWTGASVLPKMHAEMQATRIENERARLMYEEKSQQIERTFRLLQRICSSVAKSEDERQRCFD